MPNTGIIPIKVWIVLSQNDSLGERDNLGCRLTVAEVMEYMQAFQDNKGIFGPVEGFWDGVCLGGTDAGYPCMEDDDCSGGPCDRQPEVIIDPGLVPLPGQGRATDWDEFHHYVLVLGQHWDEDRLNIYFTGNITSGSTEIDAAAAGPDSEFEAHHIILNDGALEHPSGWPHIQFTPAFRKKYHYLEHELTHFLGRFNGGYIYDKCFGEGPSKRCYDRSEHLITDIEESPYRNTILDGECIPYPLNIPGNWNGDVSEAGEIWQRIEAGTWNMP